jgi:AbrB family looped-hinge helix DNA binding protein
MGEPARVGKRGTIVIPAKLRKRFHMEEGSLVLFDEGRDGVVIRPAEAIPVEIYTKERKAGFLLENSVGPADYARARREVHKMGLDPDKIPHTPPSR